MAPTDAIGSILLGLFEKNDGRVSRDKLADALLASTDMIVIQPGAPIPTRNLQQVVIISKKTRYAAIRKRMCRAIVEMAQKGMLVQEKRSSSSGRITLKKLDNILWQVCFSKLNICGIMDC